MEQSVQHKTVNYVPIIYSRQYKQLTHYIEDFEAGNKNSAIIAARRGMGKTYILNAVKKHIESTNRLKILYIKGDKTSNPYHFIASLREQLDFELIKTEKWKNYADSLFSLLSLSDKKYVLMIDDIHYLNKDMLLEYLRGKYQELTNLFLLFTVPSDQKKHILSYKDPFFGQLFVVTLNPLDKKESTKLIMQKYVNIPNPLLEKVVKIADGNVFLLNVFGAFAKSLENYPDQENEFQKLVKSFLSIYLERDLSPQVRGILSLVTQNSKITVSQLADKLCTATGAISSQLKRLEEKELIKRDDEIKVNYYVKYLFLK